MAIHGKELAGMIDATILGKEATREDLVHLADMAKQYGFFSCAFAFPCWLPMMVEELKGTGIKCIGGASSFQGNEPIELKVAMARWNVEHGCGEMENFMNYSYFKSGMYDEVVKDIRAVREAAPDMVYKVILETPMLSDDEIRTACDLCIDGGVDYVKTGTGLLGATDVHTIEVISKAVKGRAKIKASGGIRTIETVDAMLDLGVARFGVGLASAIKLVEAADQR
ncbi:deoxyribose-phosphate aldolase [Christensenellaceae bacterium NSJ-63]|uniref:Deoxyribose-phosphate aldolase n=1 Tax=Guopingia tenuis TaxID=2763656 RepID=A0A926DGK1_9FIRM|nr:deoxyribose-phosphate aldolase [Guopingia tenuis]MBC8537476.1 deoxyribose-phosphate aldolase [Guopingia tenuis]